MSIYDSAYSFLKGVSVSEKNKVVDIDGIRTPLFTIDLQNKWKTNAVSQYFFKKIRRMSLTFNSFFAPDMMYILTSLIGDRRTRSNRGVLTQVLEGLKANTWLKEATAPTFKSKLNYGALSELATELLPHQMDFLKVYDENTTRWRLNGYILGAVPGSGKTISGISLSTCLMSEVTICIVPKNAVDKVWGETLDWIHKTPRPYWKSTGDKPLTANNEYYVAHFEQLDIMVEFFRKNHQGKRISIILDESHNLNDLKSARANLFQELVKVTKPISVLWSSGTPLKALGSEVIPILRSIDPYFGPEEEDRFKKIFGLSTARALDILAHRLGLMTFKVEKSQVVGNTVYKYRVDLKIKDPKPFLLSTIKVEMAEFVKERVNFYTRNMDAFIREYREGLDYYERTLVTREQKEEFKVYKAAADDMHRGYDPMRHKTEPAFCNAFEKKKIIPILPKGIKERFVEARSVYKYMELKVKGEALGRILGKKRTECSLAMLQEWDNYPVTELATKEKFTTSLTEIVGSAAAKSVIFTSYVEVVDSTAAIFTENGFNPSKVYGDTNKDLPAIVTKFGNDEKINPLIATLQSLSTAVPLVMANTVIFLNSPFRIHEYEQACSRVDRLGQKEAVHIYDVYLDTGEEPNISTRSLDIMAWSKSMVEAMLGKQSVGDATALESIVDDFTDSMPEDTVGDDSGFLEIGNEEVATAKPQLTTFTW